MPGLAGEHYPPSGGLERANKGRVAAQRACDIAQFAANQRGPFRGKWGLIAAGASFRQNSVSQAGRRRFDAIETAGDSVTESPWRRGRS
jgi:hypothetical protein